MRKAYLSVVIASVIIVLAGCGTGGESAQHQTSGDQVPEQKEVVPEAGQSMDVKEPTNEKDEKPSSEIEDELTAHYFDVGQADSTLLTYTHEGEDYHILIDTGDWTSSDVTYYLNDLGVEQLDLLIGTHVHADHIGQMEEVVENFSVDEVWMTGNEGTSQTYENALAAIETNDVGYHEPRVGEAYEIGVLEVEVLHPSQLTGDFNDDSVSTRMTYGDISFLFTGDAEATGEAAMLRGNAQLDAHILQLGHHGSSTSTSPDFLAAVNPEVAIYSAGANNSYGHPHEEVVERVQASGIDLYGTDVHGTIVVTTDGEAYQVETRRDGTITPAAEEPSESESTEQDSNQPEQEESVDHCVDINSASYEELQEIIHIGPDRAQQIIDLRPFNRVEDLTQVHGIGGGRLGDIESEGLACVGG
ncbi:MBL fold metallo-hydrolase [Alkalibacillus aidingensis]|uniref:MBL fold metallo-hydrolase n=1 Tax=Alkalibacillus aidingensis TaxID=2747607 RepID=UPI001660C6C8|nr:MBL fold metallo-hydrolase [Alkalibacillus aidingensis]